MSNEGHKIESALTHWVAWLPFDCHSSWQSKSYTWAAARILMRICSSLTVSMIRTHTPNTKWKKTRKTRKKLWFKLWCWSLYFTLFDIVCTLHESCLDMFGTRGGNPLRSTLVPPCIQRAPFEAAPIGLARALRAGCLDDCWICMELCWLRVGYGRITLTWIWIISNI